MQIVHPSQKIWRADVTKSKKIPNNFAGSPLTYDDDSSDLETLQTFCQDCLLWLTLSAQSFLGHSMAVEEEDENVLKFMRLALAEVLLACLFSPEFLEYSFTSSTFGSWYWYIKSFVQARHALARLEVPVGYICSPNCKWVVNLWRT